MTPLLERPKINKVDDFFQLDKFQLIVLLFNEVLIYTQLSNVVFNIFGTAQPTVLGCENELFNGTRKERCAAYLSTNCSTPDVTYEFYSTVVEFNQFCSRHELTVMDSFLKIFGLADKTKFSTTSQMVGIMIGSAIAGQLSDIYGRKKITLVFLISIFMANFSSSFAPNIDIYIVIRFFIGVAGGGLTTVSGIYLIEMLPSNHRIWLCTVITWAPNYILLACVAKLAQNWRTLAFVNSLVTLAAIFVCAVLLPESPKFLVQHRRREDAIRALTYVNKFKTFENKVPRDIIQMVVDKALAEDNRVKAKKYSFLHLYSNTTLAIRTLVFSFGMFALSFVTYGLIFNLDVIKGSIYLNTAFSGLLRWVVGVLVAVSDHFGSKYVGRRRLHYTTMSTIMACMAIIFGIYYTGNEKVMAGTIQVLTLVAFGITGCLFLQILIVTSELFPTGVRNLANAHINVCGRCGNVLGPMVFSLNVSIPGFPYLLMTLLPLLDIILFTTTTPESKGVPLPTEMPLSRAKSKAKEMALLAEETQNKA